MKEHIVEIKLEDGKRYAVYFDGKFMFATVDEKSVGKYVNIRYALNVLETYDRNSKRSYHVLCGAYDVCKDETAGIRLAKN